MSSTITTAAREYASRPADERFQSLEALVQHAQHQKEASREATYNAKDLQVVVGVPDQTSTCPIYTSAGGRSNAPLTRQEENQTLLLQSPKSAAGFTHWSFGQLCRTLSAPANYLRGLPPAIAADALNHGLSHTPPGSDLKMLVQAPNGKPLPTVRACTSESYGRVWDADLFGQVAQQIASKDDRWTLPPTWTAGESAGAYRGDRDSFLIMVNGGSIVNDPSVASITPNPNNPQFNGDRGMYRGIMIRNSEVGAASITIETVLYRYICGNHILWSAAIDTRFRRRHTGQNAARDAVRELTRIAYNYTNASAARDEAIIKLLIDRQIAVTKEGVIDELHKAGATKEDAARAYELCEQTESASPRSFWGAVQGLTRASQETTHQDTRYLLDQIAAKVLAKGAKLVAA